MPRTLPAPGPSDYPALPIPHNVGMRPLSKDMNEATILRDESQAVIQGLSSRCGSIRKIVGSPHAVRAGPTCGDGAGVSIVRVRAISADHEKTWPDELRALLAASLADLRGYEAFNSDLRQRYHAGDWKARYSPPPNPYTTERQGALGQAEAILARHSITAFHCTRLHPGEIRLLFEQGLVPLSQAFLEERIANAVNDRYLTSFQAQEILASMLTDIAGRNGRTWLIFTQRTLADEESLWRLFTFWGGEAIYVPQQNKPLGDLLKKIGTPCIVEAQVPIADIRTRYPVAELLIRCYLDHRGVEQPHDAEFEGNTRNGVRAEHIRDIIERSDSRFESLTECSSWGQPI